MKRITLLILLAGLLACGGMSPQQRIVGTWQAEMFGETMTVRFLEDGTVYTVEEDETQMWEIRDGDPVILEIWDPDNRSDGVELELVFQNDDNATLTAQGMTASLERLE